MSGIRNLTGICHDLRMKLIYRIKCEASECRHSLKWTEYLEQERAVLQEIISGNVITFHNQYDSTPANPVTFLYGIITDFAKSKFYDTKNSIVVVHNSSSFAL